MRKNVWWNEWVRGSRIKKKAKHLSREAGGRRREGQVTVLEEPWRRCAKKWYEIDEFGNNIGCFSQKGEKGNRPGTGETRYCSEKSHWWPLGQTLWKLVLRGKVTNLGGEKLNQRVDKSDPNGTINPKWRPRPIRGEFTRGGYRERASMKKEKTPC